MTLILIVEDMPVQAQLLQFHLDALGHQHKTATNGREALLLLDQFRPDLIISDVEMPEMNGLELCSAVKADSALASIPVILLTAADSPIDVLRGVGAMADGYLTKPYESDLLQQTIISTVERGPYRGAEGDEREPLTFDLAGETHTVNASRHQMLNLFFSAYQSSNVQNKLLGEKEQHLTQLNLKLSRTIEQLSASEERFRGLVQTIPDIVYKVDGEGCFTFVNDAIHRLGYHQSELIGRHFSSIIFDEDIDGVSADAVLKRIRENGESDSEEAPKLFDERRTSNRMTIGLQVRLDRKSVV